VFGGHKCHKHFNRKSSKINKEIDLRQASRNKLSLKKRRSSDYNLKRHKTM